MDIKNKNCSVPAPAYEFKKLLNSNSRNAVYLALSKISGAQVVIKVAVKSSKEKDSSDCIKGSPLSAIEKEFSLMTSLNHKNILRAINLGKMLVNHKNMYQYIVYEYVTNGCMIDFLQKKSSSHPDLTNFDVMGCLEVSVLEKVSRTFFLQILSAVKFCFEHKICHRDIKLDNILVDSRFDMILSDFDLSRSFYDFDERVFFIFL
jgi:serine/threonine protein kinase